MKTRLFLLITALLMMVSANAFAQKKDKKAYYDEVSFVTSIECQNCVKKCTANLPYEKGVKDYRIDLDSKTIYFKFDTRTTTREKLAKAIEKLGYTATETETVPKSK